MISILSGAPVAVAALALGLGCAAAPQPATGAQATCAAEAGGMRITLGEAAAAGGAIRTAACRLPEGALARARAASSAVLRVEGARMPSAPTSVLVFLNDPQAGAAASTSRPSFAGSFTLLAEGPERINAQVALGGAVAAALRERGELSVTLVAVDREDRPLPQGLAFDRLVLDLR